LVNYLKKNLLKKKMTKHYIFDLWGTVITDYKTGQHYTMLKRVFPEIENIKEVSKLSDTTDATPLQLITKISDKFNLNYSTKRKKRLLKK
jgi:hypothetical protein